MSNGMLDLPSLRTASGPHPRAVLVGVQFHEAGDAAFSSSLDELQRLAETLGLMVVGRITQKRKALAGKTVVGQGKLQEIAAVTGGTGVLEAYSAPGRARGEEVADDEAEDADDEEGIDGGGPEAARGENGENASVVLVDHDLSPQQMRNLEKATGAEVLDRSMVILSIFQRHARTREARIQVEIARLTYMAPRLREAGAGQDRQRGGVGGKGAGESTLELDRRRIRDRISELRRDLELVQREADTRRSRRSGADTPTVALVGYTNAGKSFLMRALTGDEVYVADQLFATLDTTVRVLKPETHPRVLVSDTVGFIKKLPHDLVASFRSTLEEARNADLLLHIVDGADPAFRDQIQVTRAVLDEIAAADSPLLLVLNKSDRLTPAARAELAREFPEALIMSARSAEDVKALRDKVVAFFERDMSEEDFVIPYDRQRGVALLHERGRVIAEGYEDDGAHLRVRAPAAVLQWLRRELLGDGTSAPGGQPG